MRIAVYFPYKEKHKMKVKINKYIELLMEWNKKCNLTGYKTANEITEKLININMLAIILTEGKRLSLQARIKKTPRQLYY